MNEENYVYLSKQLKFTGFPAELNDQLRSKMEQNTQAFVIFHSQKNNDGEANAALSFKKSEDSDKYFFISEESIVSVSKWKLKINMTLFSFAPSSFVILGLTSNFNLEFLKSMLP